MTVARTSNRLINFPPNPTVGDTFLGNNGVTYTWMAGNYWSGVVAIQNQTAEFFYDAQYSDWAANASTASDYTIAAYPIDSTPTPTNH